MNPPVISCWFLQLQEKSMENLHKSENEVQTGHFGLRPCGWGLQCRGQSLCDPDLSGDLIKLCSDIRKPFKASRTYQGGNTTCLTVSEIKC